MKIGNSHPDLPVGVEFLNSNFEIRFLALTLGSVIFSDCSLNEV